MARFHINKHGVPAPCKAKQGNCPLGGEGSHFNNMEDAQEAADKANESEFGLLGLSKKGDKERQRKIEEGSVDYEPLSLDEVMAVRDKLSKVEVTGGNKKEELVELPEIYSHGNPKKDIITEGKYEGLTGKEVDMIEGTFDKYNIRSGKQIITEGKYKGLTGEEAERIERSKSATGNEEGYKGLSDEDIIKLTEKVNNTEIISDKSDVKIMSNDKAEARLARLKAERFNIGTDKFDERDFTREVDNFMAESILREDIDPILRQFESLDDNKSNDFILSSYVSDELINVTKSKEPNYFSDSDYKGVLHRAIEIGTSKYLDEVGEPHAIREQANAEEIARKVLSVRSNADLSTHDKMFSELESLNNMNVNLKNTITSKMENEKDPRRYENYKKRLKDAEYGIESTEYARHKLSLANQDVKSMRNYKRYWPNEIANYILRNDDNEEHISKMRSYHRSAQENSSIYYNSNFK